VDIIVDSSESPQLSHHNNGFWGFPLPRVKVGE